jgi:membrane fusion protein (multidrug efflux system)
MKPEPNATESDNTQSQDALETELPAARKSRKVFLGAIGAAALLVGAYYGFTHLRYALAHEETDDAQVEGDISPVLPRISGYVTRVLIKDNQRVEAAQPLIEIDSREPALRVGAASAALETAKSALDTASAMLANARASTAVAEANSATARVAAAKAASDLARDTRLFGASAITDRQLSDSRAAADLTRAQLEASQRQADAARKQAEVAEAQVRQAAAQISQRQSDLDYAKLQLTYTTVTAPISGIVSHKDVEPGQLVQAGQTLFAIASDSDAWIVANFKETQLAHMRPGQSVEFTVDAYPGAIFHGRIDSIAGATGARFALLPPDNASGNFVKITQRVPVKIVPADAPDPQRPLRPGMSVDAAVEVGD